MQRYMVTIRDHITQHYQSQAAAGKKILTVYLFFETF